jgi:hypothetical protein
MRIVTRLQWRTRAASDCSLERIAHERGQRSHPDPRAWGAPIRSSTRRGGPGIEWGRRWSPPERRKADDSWSDPNTGRSGGSMVKALTPHPRIRLSVGARRSQRSGLALLRQFSGGKWFCHSSADVCRRTDVRRRRYSDFPNSLMSREHELSSDSSGTRPSITQQRRRSQ